LTKTEIEREINTDKKLWQKELLPKKCRLGKLSRKLAAVCN
jgi:hypothetical protein